MEVFLHFPFCFWFLKTGFLCVDQAGIELRDPPDFVSRVLGLEVCVLFARL